MELTQQSNEIDMETATLAELDAMDLDHFLGGDVEDFDLGDALPDGVYGLMMEDYSLKSLAAKPEENKKGCKILDVKYKVTHVMACDDEGISPESLVNRVHYESYRISENWGKAMIIKTILGIVGAKFKDKKSWKSVISSFAEVLEQLKANKVQFGATIKTKEKNGYENTNIVLTEKAFMSVEKFAEQLA